MNDKTRTRDYRAFPQNVSKVPRIHASRETDATREKIARPIGATPRRAVDWR